MGKKGNKKESLILKLPLIISLCTALFSFSVLTMYPIWTKFLHNGSILGTIQKLKHNKKKGIHYLFPQFSQAETGLEKVTFFSVFGTTFSQYT